MPLYDFFCRDCGHCFEDLSGESDCAPVCPKCASQKTERLLSVPSPLKKGGFPYKPGPVHPMASRMAGGCGGGGCPSGGGGFS